MRFFLRIGFVRSFLRLALSFVYDTRYLKGFYFDEKCMGWYWALRSIRSCFFGQNRRCFWPVNPQTVVNGATNIKFHPDDLHIFQVPGCYWQAHDATITVGRNCHVAPNVGLITTNHDIYHPNAHVKGRDIVIADDCWIGMNAVVLPGVILGNHTVVAAGAVVTRSFPDGYCVLGGIPARVIKQLDRSLVE